MRPRGARLWSGGAAAVATLALLAGCATAHLRPIPPRGPVPFSPAVAVQATPVPLDPANPGRQEIDGFRYAGGIALTSADTSRLHGLSDLVVATDGTLMSVTDDGDYFRARIVAGPNGQLVGLRDATLSPLTGQDGNPLNGKASGDAEGLAFLLEGMLVSFERNHRIWRYSSGNGSGTPLPVAMPPVVMGENEGIEGLAADPSVGPGAYWVGIETGDIWLCAAAANCDEIKGLPTPAPGFRLSGLAVGPRGELAILHHSYVPLVGSRIVVSIVRDPRQTKEVIGRLAMAPSSTVDNFEGIGIIQLFDRDDVKGYHWRLFLLSDDNFNDKQRTLLLAFDWTPPR